MSSTDTRTVLSEIFRPVKYSNPAFKYENTTIADLSGGAAEFIQNKGGITVALEDFEKKFNSLHGEDNSNITAKDAKGNIFTDITNALGISRKNIYESKRAQEYLKENGNLFQYDIYYQENAKNGGILYAKSDDDVYKAALNFAKAEIDVVESANLSVDKWTGNNDKLDCIDIDSYNYYGGFDDKELLEEFDLDGKKNLSAKEYASYLLAIDTASQYYDPSAIAGLGTVTPNGLISNADTEALENMDLDEIKERAAKYFKQYD